MASLEELRKKFVKNGNPLADGAALAPAAVGLTEAAVKMFEPLKRFEVEVSDIAKIAEPLEKVLNRVSLTVSEIKTFYSEMERVSKAYDGIRTFQAALSSDASRELRGQLDALAATFCENLKIVSALIEPAKEFQARIAELAKLFEGLQPLQEQFEKLAESFKPPQIASPQPQKVTVLQ